MYLVTGATGKTGSAVVTRLLEHGVPVRAFVRSAEKGEALAKEGVEIAVGTMENIPSLTAALAGATAAYLMMPNDYESASFIEDGRRRALGYQEALARAGVQKAVGLSSVGVQGGIANGAVAREGAFERVFAEDAHVSFVRAGYFVENWAAVLDALNQGVLPTFLPIDRPIHMVASQDIGRCVADAMVAENPAKIIELAGPQDVSAMDVAAALSALSGKTIQAVQQPLEAVLPMFASIGFSEHIATLVRDMYAGYVQGTMTFEGTPTRGETPLEDTLRALFQA